MHKWTIVVCCLALFIVAMAGPITKVDSDSQKGAEKSLKTQHTPQLRRGISYPFKPPKNKGLVPLEHVLEKARSSPFLMEVIIRTLKEYGFTKEQVMEIIAAGRIELSSGRVITLQEVSQICCPMGI